MKLKDHKTEITYENCRLLVGHTIYPADKVELFIKDILEDIDIVKKESRGFMYKRLKMLIKQRAGDLK